jgi:uncharacterized protein YjbJ (UPF0337 family)
MSEGTFKSVGDNVAGHAKEAAGKLTDDGELEAEGEQQQNQGDGTDLDDLEGQAEELKDSTADQHLGDAMDDVDLEPPSS